MQIILGTAQLGHRYGVMSERDASEANAREILECAQRFDVRAIDTAPVYGNAESLIGRYALSAEVHTKLIPSEVPAASLQSSLESLCRDAVDVLYLHDADAILRPNDPMLDSAADLVGNGTHALGASIYTLEQFVAATHDPRVTVIQAPVNLFDRRIGDEALRQASRNGKRVVARSILLQGVLADPERARGIVPSLDRELRNFAQLCIHNGLNPLSSAIAWVKARPAVSDVIIGVDSADQLAGIFHILRTARASTAEIELLANLTAPPDDAVDPRTWDT